MSPLALTAVPHDEAPDDEAQRTLPHDRDAEAAVIGAAFLSPTVADELADTLSPSDFYIPANETIWAAIGHLHATGQPVDAVTVAAHLQETGALTRIGGAPYLARCLQAPPTAVSAGYYAAIVRDRASLRAIINAGQRITQIGWAADGADPHDRAEHARAALDQALNGTRALDTTAPPTPDLLLEQTLDAIETPTRFTPTGLTDLDQAFGGLAPGRLYVIGARPGIGKSILGVQLAAHVAATAPALIASLEMPAQEVMTRVLSATARVDLGRLTGIGGSLTEDDWDRIAKATPTVMGLRLHIDDTPVQGLTHLRSKIRTVTRAHGPVGVVVVDYLQLMRTRDPRLPRHEQVGELSRGLKLLAREFDVPVVALSQVNRGPLARADHRPSMGDLRESGAIENDADVIMLLHTDPDEDPGAIEVNIPKNRYGPTRAVNLAWQPYYACAGNLARSAWSPSAHATDHRGGDR